LGGKIRERHPVATADTGIDLVNLACEAMRRKPLDHRIGIEKGPIDPLGSGAQHSVKFNGVWHWLFLPMVKFCLCYKMAPVTGFAPVTHRLTADFVILAGFIGLLTMYSGSIRFHCG